MLGSLTATTLTMFGAIIFFFASAGASAAYLTASEVFPMETRALCIAFFYAIGTAVGGITGPLLFGALIDNASGSGDITKIAVGYFIGAALMVAGGTIDEVRTRRSPPRVFLMLQSIRPPVRLISVPAHHPYVAAVAPAGVRPAWADRVSGWDPDPIFDPGAVRELAGEADLVHLHFGFDQLTPEGVRRWLAELTAAELPLVFTVHDLRNPHHLDPAAHAGLLAELVPAAAELITLTPGAAAEIARRYGRDATVLPHPSLVDGPRDAAVATEPGLVGLHLKSLRRNLQDPERVVLAAAAGARGAGGRLRVDLHPEVADDPRLASLLDEPPAGVEFSVHPRFDDAELERYLQQTQVTVLPHRWGTHSGWLELARDLGARVVAPDCGFYAEQWSEVVSYINNETHGLDEVSLAAAVTQAVQLPILGPASATAREKERARVQRAHARIYARVAQSARRPAAVPR